MWTNGRMDGQMSRSVRGVYLKILRVTAHFSVITQKVVNEFLLNYGNGHE